MANPSALLPAGAAGFLKAVCAVNQRVVPPTFNLLTPNRIFAEGQPADCLYPVLEGTIKPSDAHMRAGEKIMFHPGLTYLRAGQLSRMLPHAA